MRSRVLITGGSGLLALNWALAIRDFCSVTLGIHEREVSLAGVEARQVDLESVDHLVRSFEKHQSDIVIHAAGFTNIEECEAKPDLAQRINADLSANVAKACAELGLPLVHVSTDHLFSGETPLVDEGYAVAPRNAYARTKAEAELRVLQAHPQSLVIRTNFYGWGPSYRRSFSDLVIEALRSGKEIVLFKDVFYTPILIEAAAQATHELIKRKARGVFHVVGDDRISKYEFGIHIADEFNLDRRLIKPGFIIDQVALVQRPRDMSLSNRKTCTLLGRRLEGVEAHLARLHEQENNGLAREMHNL